MADLPSRIYATTRISAGIFGRSKISAADFGFVVAQILTWSSRNAKRTPVTAVQLPRNGAQVLDVTNALLDGCGLSAARPAG